MTNVADVLLPITLRALLSNLVLLDEATLDSAVRIVNVNSFDRDSVGTYASFGEIEEAGGQTYRIDSIFAISDDEIAVFFDGPTYTDAEYTEDLDDDNIT